MPRVKRGSTHLKRRKNILKAVKGYKWGRKNRIKLAQTAILKAGVHAHTDRRTKKRAVRALWQVRINAAVREHGMSYSRFIGALKAKNVELDRKIMSQMALEYPKAFAELVAKVK